MNRGPDWEIVNEQPTLSRREVHVWRATIARAQKRTAAFRAILSPDERERAARFHFVDHQRRFVASRGLLRTILARYLNEEPGQLRFRYGIHGKPALAPGPGRGDVEFNVSHSGAIALFAVACGCRLGVDLEQARPVKGMMDIARRFFSRREYRTLCALPSQLRQEAFFTCWTRKESYLKAAGYGLSAALDRFDVSVAPGEAAALLSHPAGPRECRRWSMTSLTPAPGYVGALTVEGGGWSLRQWHWPEYNG